MYENHIVKKIMFLQGMMTIAAVLCSYLSAMIIRFGGNINEWQTQLYRTFILITVGCEIFLHILRQKKNNSRTFIENNPIQNMIEATGNVCLRYLAVAVILIFLKSIEKMSRLFMLEILAINIILECAARIIFKKILIKRIYKNKELKNLIVITDENNLILVKNHLENELRETYHFIFISCPITELLKMDFHSYDSKEALICIPTIRNEDLERLMMNLTGCGIDVNVDIRFGSYGFSKEQMREFGSICAANYSSLSDKCDVLGVSFSVTRINDAVLYIKNHLELLRGKYICFCNVHTTVLSKEDESYRNIQNSSAFTFADGAPIASQERKKGYPYAERVAGPDFMAKMFTSTMDGSVSHFFYGSTQETLDLLAEKLPARYPGMNIRGFYSPPFRSLSAQEDDEIITMLNRSGADIIWIGLGAPKQEKWMFDHQDRVHALMIGVGAGFNFHAGNIKRAPSWVRQSGLEWLYRLFQDPKRLIGRYVVTNAKYLYYIFLKK